VHYIKTQNQIIFNGKVELKIAKEQGFLTSQQQRKFIRIIANHILLNRKNPSKEDKKLWAQAAIAIFPSLRANPPAEAHVSTFCFITPLRVEILYSFQFLSGMSTMRRPNLGTYMTELPMFVIDRGKAKI
jgi:hypothetical protein